MLRKPGGQSLDYLRLSYLICALWLLAGMFMSAGNAYAITVTANSPISVGQTAATLGGFVDPGAGAIRVNFVYGTSPDNLDNQTPEKPYNIGDIPQAVTQFVSNLNCDTTYYYSINASNSIETITSDAISFTTNPCVLAETRITTLEAAEITLGSALLQGSIVTASGFNSMQYYFEYGPDTNYGSQSVSAPIRAVSSVQRDVDVDLYGLACDQTYHFRLVVEVVTLDGVEETHAGNDMSFTTQSCAGLTINAVNKLMETSNSAVLDASVNAPLSAVDVYFAYGQSRELGQATVQQTFGPGSFNLTENIRDLDCSTVYYFALVVLAADNEVQSEIKSFTTAPCSTRPLASTLDPEEVQRESAILKASVTANSAETEVLFEWGETASVEQATEPVTVAASAVGRFVEVPLSQLVCETEYFYRVIARNEVGEANGAMVSFSTLTCESPSENPNPEDPQPGPFISAGSTHSLATGIAGEVITWGNNSFGQLGGVTPEIDLIDGLKQFPESPNIMVGILDVAAGVNHSLLLHKSGDVYAFGSNLQNQLGVVTENDTITFPVKIISAQDSGQLPINVEAGESHSVVLTDLGSVFVWGDNELGQLANPAITSLQTPQVIDSLSGIKSISAGKNFTLAITAEDTVIAWGDNQYGQVGNADLSPKFEIQNILNLANIMQISAGGGHALALRKDGTVFSWGDNQAKQLGRSLSDYVVNPGQVASPSGFGFFDNATMVAAGGMHSLALLDNGTVVAWGDNSHGQLGIAGQEKNVDMPTPVVDGAGQALQGIQLIAAGEFYSLAMNEAGEIIAWGDNSSGQLDGIINTQRYGGVQTQAGIPISLKTPHLVLDSYDIPLQAGSSISLQVRLSTEPQELTRVVVSLANSSGLSLDQGSELLFSVAAWRIPQTITLSAQDSIEEQINTSLLLSSETMQSVSLPITVAPSTEEPTPRQVVGAVSWFDLLLIYGSLLVIQWYFRRRNRVV